MSMARQSTDLEPPSGMSKLTPICAMPDFITHPPPASAMCQTRAVKSVRFGPQRPGASTVKARRRPGKRQPWLLEMHGSHALSISWAWWNWHRQTPLGAIGVTSREDAGLVS
ncbi:hypothetical protein TgHK011_004625 [Trichoderma gracile]|nr:hypothetical protein TgHK011_004625 [Trichoderma gracile]